MDDLDDLLADLDGGGTQASSGLNDFDNLVNDISKPSGSGAGNELDDLMNSLDASSTAQPYQSYNANVNASIQPSSGSDLDSLMASLDAPAAAPAASGGDDLDSLMASLETPAPAPTHAAPGPAASAGDDLDSLMASLDAPATAPISAAPSAAPAAVASSRGGDDLDSLMASLDAPVVARTPVPTSAAPPAGSTDDLDSLMASLEVGSSAGTPTPQPVTTSSAAAGGDDLDSLMASLDAPAASSNVPVNARAAPSSTDDLDSLMASLDQPTAPPARAPVASSSRQVGRKKSNMDELDDLMSSLDGGSIQAARRTPQHTATPSAAPRTTAPPSSSTPVSRSRSQMDDLDDLMASLDGSGSSAAIPQQPRVGTVSGYGAASPARSPASPFAPSSVGSPAARPPAAYSAGGYGRSPGSARGGAGRGGMGAGRGAGSTGNLDNLLNNLNSSMGNIGGVAGASKGVCSFCQQPILGEMMQALGKTFHPNCFVCANCQTPLGTANFYAQDGYPHCEACYQQLFCARCAYCNQPVNERCITAMNKKWHPECFLCSQCLRPFQGGTFFERNGKPFCEQCFHSGSQQTCAKCAKPIQGNAVNALGKKWHPECFVCTYCQCSFAGGTFFERDGMPYCQQHYHMKAGSLCAACKKPITGRCVDAMGAKWCPEHFVCAFCLNPLSGGGFSEHDGKPYCRECSSKLF